MIPFAVLVTVTLVVRAAGAAGVHALDNGTVSLRAGLSIMFLLTASAHWGKRRPDLIAMVPTFFSRPDLIVTVTGVFELLGAIGILLPSTAPLAAACLAVLLIAMFPANVRAAHKHLKIGDAPATPLLLRAFLQIVFLTALFVAGFPGVFRAG